MKNFSLKDKRIKIVNNTENRGLLYSRAMGIINSNGEYIMDLDPDDEILNENDLEFLYLNTDNSQIDIINFGIITNYTDGKKSKVCQFQINTACIRYDGRFELRDLCQKNAELCLHNSILPHK